MIRLDHVTKKFKNGVVALDDLTLSIETGKIYGIVGPNGCGKSVLLRCISGLIQVTAGSIRSDDQTIGKDVETLPDTGVLFEKPGMLFNRTVRKNLEFAMEISGCDKKENIEKYIASADCGKYVDKRVMDLSMGQRQRVGLTCALMNEPRILLLDEPLNYMDREHADHYRKMICDYIREDRIIICATHLERDIEDMCDELIFMDSGHIVETLQNTMKQ